MDFGLLVAKAVGIPRSNKWPTVARKFLKDNPRCACCGRMTEIQVHHRWPFHYCVLSGRPDLELDPRNLISLCETEDGVITLNCHLLIGHLGDWRSYNAKVKEDTTRLRATTVTRRMSLLHRLWTTEPRPRLWSEMEPEDREKFRANLDQEFPK